MKKQNKNVIDNSLTAPEDRIPLKEKVCYGIGGLMDGGGVAWMSCILLKYMTTMGISIGVASTIMMLSK